MITNNENVLLECALVELYKRGVFSLFTAYFWRKFTNHT